jgi:protein tyrosine phosphatase
MTALENSARDELIVAVRKKVEALPETIYQKASSREKEDDLDGAGESYMRFLKLTKENSSVERVHAKQFLMTNFNMQPKADDTP